MCLGPSGVLLTKKKEGNSHLTQNFENHRGGELLRSPYEVSEAAQHWVLILFALLQRQDGSGSVGFRYGSRMERFEQFRCSKRDSRKGTSFATVCETLRHLATRCDIS